jgi:hypothetical protein
LTSEAQLETELVTLQQHREGAITEEQKRELLSFARDFPKLWDDPHSLPEQKKHREPSVSLHEIGRP